MTPEAYELCIRQAGLCAAVLADHDIGEALAHVNHIETVGPILDPTAFRAGMNGLREQRALLEAARPLAEFRAKYLAGSPARREI